MATTIGNSLVIKDSPIHGQGLFTLVPRFDGEVIGVALDKIGETGDPDHDYRQTMLGRHINHSDIPNVEVFRTADGNLHIQADGEIEAGEELLADYKQFADLMDSLRAKAADHRYVEKKKEESGNITYIYSDKHVKERNKAKAERVQKLSKTISKMRRRVKSDLKSDNLNTRYVALAVALMDETYERIGNDDSAETGHFGVITWRPKHVKFQGGKAVISYVGKSGVKQKKEVRDKTSVRLLRELTKGKGKGDKLFVGEEYFVNGNKVNTYLHLFDITAKDIRGFHANDEMRAALKKVRSGGGKLPSPGKERESKLKKEFKKALEETAKLVGHKPSTLKNQYLVPGMFAAYVENGTILRNLAKTAALSEEEYEFVCQRANELKMAVPCEREDGLVIVAAEGAFRKVISLVSRSYRKTGQDSALLDAVRLQYPSFESQDFGNSDESGFMLSSRITILATEKPSEWKKDLFPFLPERKEAPADYLPSRWVRPLETQETSYVRPITVVTEPHIPLKAEEAKQLSGLIDGLGLDDSSYIKSAEQLIKMRDYDRKVFVNYLPLRVPWQGRQITAIEFLQRLKHEFQYDAPLLDEITNRIHEQLRGKGSYRYDIVQVEHKPPTNMKVSFEEGEELRKLAEPLGYTVRVNEIPPRGDDEEFAYLLSLTVGTPQGKEVKITKLLTKLKSKYLDEAHQKLFKDIEKRFSLLQPPTWSLVVSAEPADIMTMSTGHGWKSCVTEGHCNFYSLDHAVSNYDMTAYAVSGKGKRLARMWLRFDGEKWWPEPQVYGVDPELEKPLKEAVEKYLNDKGIRGTNGKYYEFSKGWSDYGMIELSKMTAEIDKIRAAIDKVPPQFKKERDTFKVQVAGRDADWTSRLFKELPDVEVMREPQQDRIDSDSEEEPTEDPYETRYEHPEKPQLVSFMISMPAEYTEIIKSYPLIKSVTRQTYHRSTITFSVDMPAYLLDELAVPLSRFPSPAREQVTDAIRQDKFNTVVLLEQGVPQDLVNRALTLWYGAKREYETMMWDLASGYFRKYRDVESTFIKDTGNDIKLFLPPNLVKPILEELKRLKISKHIRNLQVASTQPHGFPLSRRAELANAGEHFELDEDKTLLLDEKVIDALKEAEGELPSGYDFLLIHGYRTPAEQYRINEETERELKESGADQKELERQTAGDPKSPMDHRSGKAVDLKLTKDGKEVELGGQQGDERDRLDYYEDRPSLSKREEEITYLFRLAAEALKELGGYNTLEPEAQFLFDDLFEALWSRDIPRANRFIDRILDLDVKASLILSKRAAKHESAMLAIMAPPRITRKLKKLTDQDDLHLTLLYLGKNLDKATLEAVRKAAERICAKHAPLDMTVTGAGVFAPGDKGIPIYLIPNAKGLSALQADLETAISALIDLPVEHGWVPHMTLSYADDTSEIPEIPDISWTAKSVRLQAAGKPVADLSLGLSRKAALIEPPPAFTEKVFQMLLQHYGYLVSQNPANASDVREAAAKFAKHKPKGEPRINLEPEDLASFSGLDDYPALKNRLLETPFTLHIEAMPYEKIRERGALGSFSPEFGHMFVAIATEFLNVPDMNKFTIGIRNLKETAAHESVHLMQTLMKKLLGGQDFSPTDSGTAGGPSLKHRLPYSDFSGHVKKEDIPKTGIPEEEFEEIKTPTGRSTGLYRLPHALRDVEFYSNLRNFIITTKFRLENFEPEKRLPALKILLETPDPANWFLFELKKHNPANWKKAIRLITAEMLSDPLFGGTKTPQKPRTVPARVVKFEIMTRFINAEDALKNQFGGYSYAPEHLKRLFIDAKIALGRKDFARALELIDELEKQLPPKADPALVAEWNRRMQQLAYAVVDKWGNLSKMPSSMMQLFLDASDAVKNGSDTAAALLDRLEKEIAAAPVAKSASLSPSADHAPLALSCRASISPSSERDLLALSCRVSTNSGLTATATQKGTLALLAEHLRDTYLYLPLFFRPGLLT